MYVLSTPILFQTFKVSVYHTFFAQDFAAMGSSSFNPHTRFLEYSAEWTGGAA